MTSVPIDNFHVTKNNGKIVTWDVTESLESMLSKACLSNNSFKKYNTLSEKRKKEYLGLRLCLDKIGVKQDVFYKENGKPFLESDHHISISHSYDKVSVGLSEFKIGIDIELSRPRKILNIKEKFIRDDENEWLENKSNKTDYLHIIWGIKEGLYKLNGGNLWNFLHHYKVNEFSLSDENIMCWISDKKTSRNYEAYYKKTDNYYLVWVLDYN